MEDLALGFNKELKKLVRYIIAYNKKNATLIELRDKLMIIITAIPLQIISFVGPPLEEFKEDIIKAYKTLKAGDDYDIEFLTKADFDKYIPEKYKNQVNISELISVLSDTWAKLDTDEKKEMIRCLLQMVVYYSKYK